MSASFIIPRFGRMCPWLIGVSVILFSTISADALARAGGGRSAGRSFGFRRSAPPPRRQPQPAQPQHSTEPQPQQQKNPGAAPQNQPQQQPNSAQPPISASGGGFLRGVMGGIAGGFLGSMLFRSFAPNGGWGGGGGFGFLEILLLCGLGYLAYRFIRQRQENTPQTAAGPAWNGGAGWGSEPRVDPAAGPKVPELTGSESPSTHVTSEAASLSADPVGARSTYVPLETLDRDRASDIFFRVQAAWTRRDLGPVRGMIASEMQNVLDSEMERLIRAGHTNRLENISLREVFVDEPWLEGGLTFQSVRFVANVLDYVTDDAGNIIHGNALEPVRFEEEWTFRKDLYSPAWLLAGIEILGA